MFKWVRNGGTRRGWVTTLLVASAVACSSSDDSNLGRDGALTDDADVAGSEDVLSSQSDGDVGSDSASVTDRAQQIDEYVRGLSPLPYDDPKVENGTASEPVEEGDYRCVTQPRSETKSYDSVVALAANSSALWPGALVRGDSVQTGQLTPIAIDRAPLTISVSLENLDGNRSATMASPTLSSFRETIGQILAANLTGATPANIYSEIETVYSQEQLALALGAKSTWPGDFANIAGSFDFNSDERRSRLVVRFVQAYYTVDIDPPSKPSSFFADTVGVDDLEAVMTDSSPPVYVSSITYGRMVVFTVESSYSSSEMKSALEFAYRGGTDVSGDVSLTYSEMLSSSKITAFILGGSGDDAVQAIDGFDALSEYIKAGGNYSKDSPGAPIAYKLAHLADNTPARLSFTQDYDVVSCERVSQRVRVQLKGITVENAGGDLGGNLELFGSVHVSSPEVAYLFSKTVDEVVTIDEGTTWPESGSIGDRVISVTPEAGSNIVVRYMLLDSDALGDDTICDDFTPFAFESGWRRDVTLNCAGNGISLTLLLRLDPV